jgi:branched-subunit amino acid ABC-type transport system permease component
MSHASSLSTRVHNALLTMAHLLATFIGVAFAIASLVLLSLGLAIIYGMMGVINLAQGEFIMLGAYTVVFSSAHGVNLWIGMALAPILSGPSVFWWSGASFVFSTDGCSIRCWQHGG